MSTDRMPIEEYLQLEVRNLNQFFDYWLALGRQMRGVEVTEAEWREQFLDFLKLEGK